MVAVGADEYHEFQRQSKNYTIFLQKHGVPAEYLSMPGKNHFNIIHDFLGDGGSLCKKFLNGNKKFQKLKKSKTGNDKTFRIDTLWIGTDNKKRKLKPKQKKL